MTGPTVSDTRRDLGRIVWAVVAFWGLVAVLASTGGGAG